VDAFFDPTTGADFYPQFQENTKDIPNIIPVPNLCPWFPYSRYVDKPADIFFIDAAHKNPNDWEIIVFALKNLKSGGLLCGPLPRFHTCVGYDPDPVPGDLLPS
jgi:hypothetical protein